MKLNKSKKKKKGGGVKTKLHFFQEWNNEK